jgi:hypothetical protein
VKAAKKLSSARKGIACGLDAIACHKAASFAAGCRQPVCIRKKKKKKKLAVDRSSSSSVFLRSDDRLVEGNVVWRETGRTVGQRRPLDRTVSDQASFPSTAQSITESGKKRTVISAVI